MERAIEQLENALEKLKEEKPGDGSDIDGFYETGIAELDKVVGYLYENIF